MTTETFGAFRPSPLQERFCSLARLLPANYFGRKAASLLLGPAGGRAARPYDVEIFGGQKARLHPFDNICEKRVFLTPQLWDSAERALLGAAIAKSRGGNFIFADVGANVGLYTLFARGEAIRAGVRLNAVCIEADPEMAARLTFNLAASGATDEAAVFNCAASAAEGEMRFSVNRKSRGLSRLDPDGEARVQARPLLSIIADAGVARIDAMKIDIEGHEFEALSAFFRDAPQELLPNLMIVELSHAGEGRSPEKLLRDKDYRKLTATPRNTVFEKTITRPDNNP